SFVEIQIDLLLGDSAYHHAALSRRMPLELPGLSLEVFTLACEDLILHKLLAGRLLDRADVGALLRQNRAALDLVYLFHWAHNLAVDKQLARVWRQAFPGEALPR